MRRLIQFLRRLPNSDKHRELPEGMPKMPNEFYQPIFSNEDIETLAWSCVIDDIPSNLAIRLLVASVYGARLSELVELTSSDITLDGADSTIRIQTKKGGQKKQQPIPLSLVPLFAVPIKSVSEHVLQRKLKKICKMAGVHLPPKAGFHSIRRRTVTALAGVEDSDTTIADFMRWAKPRTMYARYRQTVPEEGDRKILAKHPFVKLWEEVTPYLLENNSSYKTGSLFDNSYYHLKALVKTKYQL